MIEGGKIVRIEAMKEFTAKVKITPQILGFVRKYAVDSRVLSALIESYWKPKGVDLKDFHPAQKAIRLRAPQVESQPAVVEELNTFLKEGSYTHDKRRLFRGTRQECMTYLQERDYEKCGEVKLRSTEYKVKLPGGVVINVLKEELDGKKAYIKFEAEKEEEIKEIMKLLSLFPKDLILKNRAHLLVDEIGLV